MSPKNSLINFIKGFILGIANIIPGVSGGTLAVSLGLYETILSSLGNLFYNIKKNSNILLPIFLGVFVALITTSKLVTYALNNFKAQTIFLFVGLIFGGTSLIMKKTRGKINITNFLIFFITFTIVILLNFLEIKTYEISFDNVNIISALFLLLAGFIASSAMVIPGISGSFILMLLGYYEKIIATVSNLTNLKELGNNLLVLIPFGIGALIGIFFMAKLISSLISKYETKTYYGILGFILSSIVVLLFQIETFNYNFTNIATCVLIFLWGYILARAIDKE